MTLRLIKWNNILMNAAWSGGNRPTHDHMQALELCISDCNKQLLLANANFIPYLINGLFLDPQHPRADLKNEIKEWNQTMHAECLAQLALFPQGRDALRQGPAVSEALQAVVAHGLTAEARNFAQGALLALSDQELQMRTEGDSHVMLSYQWSSQSTIQRINESLISRGFITWFDLTNMKGSTMDASESS